VGLWLKNEDGFVPVSGGGGGGSFDGEHVLTGDPDSPPEGWAAGQLLYDGVEDAGGGAAGGVRSSGVSYTSKYEDVGTIDGPVFVPEWNVPVSVKTGDTISVDSSMWIESTGGTANALSVGFGLYDASSAEAVLLQDLTPSEGGGITSFYVEANPSNGVFTWSVTEKVTVTADCFLMVTARKSSPELRRIGHVSIRSMLSCAVTGSGGGDDAGPHDHDYLPLEGGTLTGDLFLEGASRSRISNYSSAGSERLSLFGATDGGATIRLYGDGDNSYSAGRVQFLTGGVERMRITQAGRVTVAGDLQVEGIIIGGGLFYVKESIDTADVLDRAETATMPAPEEAGVEGLTVNEVVTALLLKVKELSADIKELKGN
jgi:hypothetical protein